MTSLHGILRYAKTAFSGSVATFSSLHSESPINDVSRFSEYFKLSRVFEARINGARNCIFSHHAHHVLINRSSVLIPSLRFSRIGQLPANCVRKVFSLFLMHRHFQCFTNFCISLPANFSLTIQFLTYIP